MAIIPSNEYPGQIDPSDPNYPQGKARNIVIPGDGTGTPLEEAWVNDMLGFFQALLLEAGVTPSGSPDNAVSSQYLLSLKSGIEGIKKTVESFDDAINGSHGTATSLSTQYHSVDGFGSADYVKNGDTGTPSTGNEVSFFDADGDGWVIVTDGDFFNAHCAGVVPGDDIATSFQKAIDISSASGLNVLLPSADYTSSAAFSRQKGQIVKGVGIPQRSLNPSTAPVTRITFTNDTEAFEDQTNIALGGGVSNMILVGIGSATSTKEGVRCGIEGIQGGSSQPLQTLFEDLYITGFDTSFGLHGWAWGAILRRVFADGFKTYGINITDAANAVHLDTCHAILGASAASGTRTGIRVSSSKNVTITSPRIENNRIGLTVSDGADVTVSALYSEGNRDGDVQIISSGTKCLINGMLAQHQNDGQVTAYIFRTAGTDRTTSLVANNVTIIVTAGAAGQNNTLNNMLESNTDANVEITNIDWEGDGDLWPMFAGRFAPDLLTFNNLVNVEVRRAGTAGGAEFQAVSFMNDNGFSAPAANRHQLINYDGGIIDLAYENSRVVSVQPSNGVNYWKRASAAWVAVNE